MLRPTSLVLLSTTSLFLLLRSTRLVLLSPASLIVPNATSLILLGSSHLVLSATGGFLLSSTESDPAEHCESVLAEHGESVLAEHGESVLAVETDAGFASPDPERDWQFPVALFELGLVEYGEPGLVAETDELAPAETGELGPAAFGGLDPAEHGELGPVEHGGLDPVGPREPDSVDLTFVLLRDPSAVLPVAEPQAVPDPAEHCALFACDVPSDLNVACSHQFADQCDHYWSALAVPTEPPAADGGWRQLLPDWLFHVNVSTAPVRVGELPNGSAFAHCHLESEQPYAPRKLASQNVPCVFALVAPLPVAQHCGEYLAVLSPRPCDASWFCLAGFHDIEHQPFAHGVDHHGFANLCRYEHSWICERNPRAVVAVHLNLMDQTRNDV